MRMSSLPVGNVLSGSRDHQQMHLLLSRLFVTVESNCIGPDGDWLFAQITGLDEKMIQIGWQELASPWRSDRSSELDYQEQVGSVPKKTCATVGSGDMDGNCSQALAIKVTLRKQRLNKQGERRNL